MASASPVKGLTHCKEAQDLVADLAGLAVRWCVPGTGRGSCSPVSGALSPAWGVTAGISFTLKWFLLFIIPRARRRYKLTYEQGC